MLAEEPGTAFPAPDQIEAQTETDAEPGPDADVAGHVEPPVAIEAEAQPATLAEPEPEAVPGHEPAAFQPEPDGSVDPAERAAPVAAAAPRTVGRVIAEALRAAGVRYAFTVPGESFLGLLEGLV